MLQNKIPSDILHYFVTESPFLSLREQLNRQVLFRVKGQLPKKNLQEIKKQKQRWIDGTFNLQHTRKDQGNNM